MKTDQKRFVVQKPWGNFEQFCLNTRTTVKILTVKPHAILSLQRHSKRHEFWFVLEGPAGVQIGKKTKQLNAGQSAKIPRGAIHRLSAKNRTAKILEISFGEFDESDIVRLEDAYGRIQKK